jgi:hypothetical protein
MTTLKLTDKEIKVLKDALDDYHYSWSESLEGSKEDIEDGMYDKETLKKMKSGMAEVKRNLKAVDNIFTKIN